MIEHHRNGRHQHMLVDDEGWAALKSGVATVSTLDPGTYLAGLDIYRNECPCTPENVDGPT